MYPPLSRCIDRVLALNRIHALYIYGSFVNGYYHADSDIDVVALTYDDSRPRPMEMQPNISVHMIHPITFRFFEAGYPYAHLRMVPVHNKPACVEISDRIKSELVRRELIRFRKAGIEEFDVFDPFNNFLLTYGVQRPWRIKPIKRLIDSTESRKILKEEYLRVLHLLEQKEIVRQAGDRFIINPDHVFEKGDKVQNVMGCPKRAYRSGRNKEQRRKNNHG